MERWRGKTAIVTGASSGIGAAVASALLSHGVTVINLDRDAVDSEEGAFFARRCDITDKVALAATFQWIESTFSCVNIHVNCAGVAHNLGVLSERDDAAERIDHTIAVNFTAAVSVTREAFRLLRKSADFGIIVNVASLFGHVIPFPVVGNVYAATKFAVRAFTETVRHELIVSGCEKIRVSCISPGTVKTSVRVSGGWDNTEEFYRQRPFLEAKEIGDAVVYLLSTPYNVNVTELVIRPVGEKF